MGETKLRETETISETIKELAVLSMKPKALIEAVKARHPSASKKDIARAAFLTIILSAEYASKEAQALHDLASETSDGESFG
ncbi:hypothetical protein [Ensifer sp. ENS12]|uniref:hypothetical protein n=1 Tax=unclassified Ensifer TaxID=2633371 RepID=UPI000DE58FC9|nr:hypothetical protein [Ensifer sp. ENS12]MBV7522193.1 hypothetical protein [Ensifer sp. ENS12]